MRVCSALYCFLFVFYRYRLRIIPNISYVYIIIIIIIIIAMCTSVSAWCALNRPLCAVYRSCMCHVIKLVFIPHYSILPHAFVASMVKCRLQTLILLRSFTPDLGYFRDGSSHCIFPVLLHSVVVWRHQLAMRWRDGDKERLGRFIVCLLLEYVYSSCEQIKSRLIIFTANKIRW